MAAADPAPQGSSPPSPGRGFSNQQPKSRGPRTSGVSTPAPAPLRHVADAEVCLSLHQCSHWWSRGKTLEAALGPYVFIGKSCGLCL